MITLRIKYDDTTVGIQFPCSDSVIASKLMELHASDHEGDPFFVEEVIEPKELTKFFEHRFVDLDETNYLAKRMESFLPSEMLQFYGAALQEGHLTVKDLINTTLNLGRHIKSGISLVPRSSQFSVRLRWIANFLFERF